MAADPVLRREVLRAAHEAIVTAWPYVNGVALDSSLSPWRRETARASLATLEAARDLISEALRTQRADGYYLDVELSTLTDDEYAYVVQRAGEDYFERAYSLAYLRESRA